jgi:hypothetical protein
MSDQDYCLEWKAGPSAQLELFSPDEREGSAYAVKYTPPFRSTLRPPVQRQPLGAGELQPINQMLEGVVSATRSGRGQASSPGDRSSGGGSQDLMETMVQAGRELFELVVPHGVKAELRSEPLFLEIGMDENLLEYPWELMHDKQDFLCAKHYVGRFVNVRVPPPPPAREPRRSGSLGGPLKVLLVSVPRPLDRDGRHHDHLAAAESETEEVAGILSSVPGVELSILRGKDATRTRFLKALDDGEFHVIHYNGHAHFDEDHPHMSALVLYDQDLTTGPLVSYLTQQPPIFCFLNACETGTPPGWREQYSVFGLARALLETGSYMLGSRWNLGDAAAKTFASVFYQSLLGHEKTFGEALMDARTECRTALPDDFDWASYVYYGDPRVYFRGTSVAAGDVVVASVDPAA